MTEEEPAEITEKKFILSIRTTNNDDIKSRGAVDHIEIHTGGLFSLLDSCQFNTTLDVRRNGLLELLKSDRERHYNIEVKGKQMAERSNNR